MHAAHQQNQPRAEWSDNGRAYRQLVRGREPVAKQSSSPGGAGSRKRTGQSVLSKATNRVGVNTAHRVAVRVLPTLEAAIQPIIKHAYSF